MNRRNVCLATFSKMNNSFYFYLFIVIGLLFRERSSESSEVIEDASHAARCLRKVQVFDTDKLRRS